MQQLKGCGQRESWKQLGSSQAECTPWRLCLQREKTLSQLTKGTLSENPQGRQEEGKVGLSSELWPVGLSDCEGMGQDLSPVLPGCWFTQQGWRLSSFPSTMKTRAFESISKEHITRRTPLILNPWESQSIRSWGEKLRPRIQILDWGVGVFFLSFWNFWFFKKKFWVERVLREKKITWYDIWVFQVRK